MRAARDAVSANDRQGRFKNRMALSEYQMRLDKLLEVMRQGNREGRAESTIEKVTTERIAGELQASPQPKQVASGSAEKAARDLASANVRQGGLHNREGDDGANRRRASGIPAAGAGCQRLRGEGGQRSRLSKRSAGQPVTLRELQMRLDKLLMELTCARPKDREDRAESTIE